MHYDVKHSSTLIKCPTSARIGEVTAFDDVKDHDTINQVRCYKHLFRFSFQ